MSGSTSDGDNSNNKYKCDEKKLWANFDEKIRELSPTEQQAVKKFWRSVVMRTPRVFVEENGRLPHGSNVRSCNCCPYGYHIDLDFVRYCEALANAKPSDEELRRRSRRRSRKSMEFMLGLENLFDQWDAAERVQALPEASHESEPESPRLPLTYTPYNSNSCNNNSNQRPRSSSVPRFTYGGLTRSESPFGTASSTCSSLRGGGGGGVGFGGDTESDCPFPMRRPANSPPETRAFLHDALDEVCSDFERTLERASMKRKKGEVGGANGYGIMSYSLGSNGSDRNNNNKIRNGYSCSTEKRNCHTWEQYYEVIDSCVTGNKSPRSSRYFSKSSTLPFQQKLSPAELQYESYVQATVAANAKSPVEQLLSPPPPPPPRRHHTLQAKLLLSPTVSGVIGGVGGVGAGEKSPLIGAADKSVSGASTLLSPSTSSTLTDGAGGGGTDAQTLYNIRQQMALSLKRMKDLEEQVKTIPELQHELTSLRNEKDRLQQSLQRKDDELQRARDTTLRFSSSPSPVASPKYASPVQFTPQRISPVSLDSLGGRLRTNSTCSEKQFRSLLKRDVGTMCGLHATRDIAVGTPVITLRTIGTSPAQILSITEMLYTQLEMEQRIQLAIRTYEEQRTLAHLKKLISVGTQMFVPKQELRDSSIQTTAEKTVVKYTVGITAKPQTRDNFASCKPEMRTIGTSEDRITDPECSKCDVSKRHVGCSTQDVGYQQVKAVSLKLLDTMPGRSNTFSLGDNERLNIIRKSTGTQYTPIVVNTAACQTMQATVRAFGVQITPEMHSMSTQSHIDCSSQQTDTRDLIRLCCTQTSTEEIVAPQPRIPTPPPAAPVNIVPTAAPAPPAIVALPPPKPQTRSTACNTDMRKTTDYGVNTAPPASTRHSSSNTEEIHKRDIACGDAVKPHISIACADNYCDSCKDAIKNLAKDFSKVLASPLPTRAVDSKIPRPKHLTSPSPVRRHFKRQNTYTITPSPTPSPVAEKKSMASSLHERTETLASFHQSIESSGETESFITEPTSQLKNDASSTLRRSSNASLQRAEELEAVFAPEAKSATAKTYESAHAGGVDDLIVREETRVRISWSRDASPAPLAKDGSPLKSLESSFNEKLKESTESTESSPDVSKGARRKTPSPLKSSQIESAQHNADNGKENAANDAQLHKAPSKALLQKLAMVEAEPRKKISPPKEMLAALKIINESLLKKMGAKPFSSSSLKTAKATIQQEWFRISSTDKANPLEVEDYLDCFEEMSVPLLEYCVNMIDVNGNTAMHYAVSHGNFDIVSILVDSKVCNVNQMNNAGYTCVMLVSLAKLKNAAHRTVVERLFQMADVNIRAKKHCQTALMLAVSHGNLDMVEMLLAAGADINIQDEDGSTALMCAAEHGRIDIVKHLLSQSDCDSLIQDMDGSTAFKIAWQAGHRDIGLLLYVHEQMLRSKLPNRGEPPRTPTLSPRQHKRHPSQ